MKNFALGSLVGVACVAGCLLVLPWLFKFFDWYFPFVRSL